MTTFTYAANGLRRKTVVGGATKIFVWDHQNILLETGSTGTTNAAYTQTPDQYGALVAQRRSGASIFYHFDALGSMTELTNSAQTVTDVWRYYAFGETKFSIGSTPNPFQFVGRLGYYTETTLGLQDLRARWYKPGAGRFLSTDPIGPASRYGYVGNRPVGVADPSGMQPTPALRPMPRIYPYTPKREYEASMGDWLKQQAETFRTRAITARDRWLEAELVAWMYYLLGRGWWQSAVALNDWGTTDHPGERRTFRLDLLYADQPQLSQDVEDLATAFAQYVVKHGVRGGRLISSRDEAQPIQRVTPRGDDWYFMFGPYYRYGIADVDWEDDGILMRMTVWRNDAYNFPGLQKLHECGLARNYLNQASEVHTVWFDPDGGGGIFLD